MLIDSGACCPGDVIRNFGVSKSSVFRSLKKYRTDGAAAFFAKRKGRRGGTVLTPKVLQQAQALFDQGSSRGEVSKELKVKGDTLRKAISDGRLRVVTKQPDQSNDQPTTTKTERDEKDAQEAKHLGTGCTRPEERTLAAFGMSEGAPIIFEPCVDVPKGGVLCALPSLILNGLLDGSEKLPGSTYRIL